MDRKWLIKNRLTTRLSGKIYFLLLNDAAEIANAEGLSLVYLLFCFGFRILLNFLKIIHPNQCLISILWL